MSTQVKRRRGTTAEHEAFTGAEAEATVDTDKNTFVIHDGATQGGFPLAKEDLSNVPATVALGLASLDVDNLGFDGHTISSDTDIILDAAGDVLINGDTIKVDKEMTTTDNVIVLNDGETGSGITAGEAGLQFDRGTETNYEILFQESNQLFSIGEVGSLQAVATRPDSPDDTGLTFWNDTENWIETSSDLTFDGSTFFVPEIRVRNNAGGKFSSKITISGNSDTDPDSLVAQLAARDNQGGSRDWATIDFVTKNSHNNSEIVFKNWGSFDSLAEKARITHEGNFSIVGEFQGAGATLTDTLTGVDADLSSTLDVGGDLTAEANLLSDDFNNATWAGNGYRGTNAGDWVVENLRVRNALEVYEFVAKQISSVGGKEILSIANGRVESIDTGANEIEVQDVRAQNATSFRAGDLWIVQVSDINNDLESGGSGAVVRSIRGSVSSVSGNTLTVSVDEGSLSDLEENDLIVSYGSSESGRNAIMYRNVDRSDDELITRVQTEVTSHSALTAIGNTRFAYGDVVDYWNDSTGESQSEVFGSFAGDINGAHILATDQDVLLKGVNLDVTSLPRVSDEGIECYVPFENSAIDGSERTSLEGGSSSFSRGIAGLGADFNGTSDGYQYTDLSQTEYIICSIWFDAQKTATARTIFQQLGDNGDRKLRINSSDQLMWHTRSTSGSAVEASTSDWTAGRNHAIFVQNVDDIRLYLNGELVDENSTDGDAGFHADFSLGYRRSGDDRHFDGQLDEFRAYRGYDIDMSEAELAKTLYLNPSGARGGLISTEQLVADQGFFNEIFAQDVDVTGTLTMGTGGILEAESGAYSMDDDSFVIDVPNLLVDSTNEEIEVGSVFSADGANDTGALAGARFNEFSMWGLEDLKADSPFVLDWESGFIDLTDSDQVGLRLLSGEIPEIEMTASNGDVFHIGGDFSFDGEEDVSILRGDWSPDIPLSNPSITVSDGSDDSDSNTHTYDISDYQDRFLRLSFSFNISASNQSTSDIATANATIEFRFLDDSGSTIEEYTDGGNVVANDSSVSDSGTISVSESVPLNAAEIVVVWDIEVVTDGSDTNASASIDFSDPVGLIIGEQEFLSPMGMQMTNQDSSRPTPERVRLERDIGLGLFSQAIIEGPNGEQARFYISGGQIHLEDVHGTGNPRESWNVTAP